MLAPSEHLRRPRFRQRTGMRCRRITVAPVAMAAVPTDKANALLASLRAVTSRFDSSAVVGDEELAAAAATMRDLRMVLSEFPSLPPTSVPHASAVEQQTIARSAFEQACLLAVRAGDGAALERAWSQLVPFYGDLA